MALLLSDCEEQNEVFMNRWKQSLTRYRTVLLGGGATILMLCFLVFFMDAIVMPIYTHQGNEEELPDVTEISFAEARQILESRGFSIIKEAEKFDETYPESTVIFQNPPSFSRVKKGRRIYVTLSAGEKMILVPRVVGSSERDAEFVLRQAGLELGEVFYEYHRYHLKDVVFSQSIDPGMEVAEHTPVDITVSMGRAPDQFVVPDVTGKSLEEARRMLMRAGLRVGQVSREAVNNLVPDTVIRQSLNPGDEVSQGQRVDLIVSRLGGES